MSSSASSPEPEITSKKPKKSKPRGEKNKNKLKSKATVTQEDETASEWEFKPPPGSVLLDLEGDAGEFDWDRVNEDENLELWVVRVPDTVKPKHLGDIKLDNAPSKNMARVGSIDRKQQSYDIWSLGEASTDYVGGEELKGLSCLLPRQKKGSKLYQAPKPIARHLVVTTKAELPTPAPSSEPGSDSASPTYKNPPRYRYPTEVLKHRFMPLGSLAPTPDTPESMDVDRVEEMLETSQNDDTPVKAPPASQPAGAEEGETVKKRKVGGDGTTTKSKKARASKK